MSEVHGALKGRGPKTEVSNGLAPRSGHPKPTFWWFGTQVRAPKPFVLGGRGFQVTPHTKTLFRDIVYASQSLWNSVSILA